MADTPNKGPTIYYIPDNFVGEEKILGGRIRVRYLIDSIGLALILLSVIWLPLRLTVIAGWPLNIRLTSAMVCAAPGILIGYFGYNGGPVSNFIINYFKWIGKRRVRIYNQTARLLGTDPVKAIHEEERFVDKLVKKHQARQQKLIERKNSEQFIEGETFEFAYDPGIDDYLDDVGDYSQESMDSSDVWPRSTVVIDSGSDMDDLMSILGMDDYDEPVGSSGSSAPYKAYTDDGEEDESV